MLGFVFRVCIYLSIYRKWRRWNRVARMSGSEQVQSVEVEKTASPSLPPAAAAAVASPSSCRKKKSDTTSTTFFGDVVDHIDEFVHASMDEHKDCLKKTLNKVNFCLWILHVFVYVCVCIFVTWRGASIAEGSCCGLLLLLCFFFPLRVITRHDKAFLRRRAIWTIVAVVCRFFCPFWRGGKKGEKFYRNAACSVNLLLWGAFFLEVRKFWQGFVQMAKGFQRNCLLLWNLHACNFKILWKMREFCEP